MLVRAELASRNADATRSDPLGEVRDRARPERDIDERVEIEDPLALCFRKAASNCDHEIRIESAFRPRVAEMAASRVSGFSRIVQVLNTSTSASSGTALSPSPIDSSMPLIRSES